jgi:hypothetical protein
VTLVELHADRPGGALVDGVHVRVEVAPQRLPPQTGVHEIRPLAVELGLELVLVDGAHQVLELLVGGQDDRRRRHLVDVSHLQPHDAVLDVIDDAHPVARADLRAAFDQLDQGHALAVERHGNSSLEIQGDGLRLVRRLLRAGDELEDVVLGGMLEVLDPATLRGAPPEVVVDRVRGSALGALARAGLDRDPVLAGVGDLLLAAHLPGAHRRDHLQLGRERGDRRLDPHLVVALAGAPVGDRVAAARARLIDGELGDQRTPERGEQRIAAAVQGVGPDRRGQVVARELLPRVHHVALERAEAHGLVAHQLVVLPRLPEVDRQAHHLRVVGVLDPLQHHARVQAPRVQQQHPLDVLGISLVGGAARGGYGVLAAHGLES